MGSLRGSKGAGRGGKSQEGGKYCGVDGWCSVVKCYTKQALLGLLSVFGPWKLGKANNNPLFPRKDFVLLLFSGGDLEAEI